MVGKQYRLGADALFHHDHQQCCRRRGTDGLRDAQDLVLQVLLVIDLTQLGKLSPDINKFLFFIVVPFPD